MNNHTTTAAIIILSLIVALFALIWYLCRDKPCKCQGGGHKHFGDIRPVSVEQEGQEGGTNCYLCMGQISELILKGCTVRNVKSDEPPTYIRTTRVEKLDDGTEIVISHGTKI